MTLFISPMSTKCTSVQLDACQLVGVRVRVQVRVRVRVSVRVRARVRVR